jgi:hypothetical protein
MPAVQQGVPVHVVRFDSQPCEGSLVQCPKPAAQLRAQVLALHVPLMALQHVVPQMAEPEFCVYVQLCPSAGQVPWAGKHAAGPGGLVQSTPVQQAVFATHVPSEHTRSFAVTRFVSQPSLSGVAELQSAQPAAQPVYEQPPGPHVAPWLSPVVVSHVMPQPVQLLTVSSGWQRLEQHPLPAGHPWVASQPLTHLLFEHVWPSEQFESIRHSTHVWFAVSQTVALPPPPSLAASEAASVDAPPSMTGGQSALFLHPEAQAVPAQYSPMGQLSLDGKHCTHVSFIVSHQGVAPWHCEFTVHCTHICDTHCSPVGHGCVAVQPGTHALALHTVPAAQSLLCRQATQVSLVVLHLAVGAEQFVSCKHPTHALVIVSQTVAVGQVLVASQPMAQALLTQR